MKDVIRRIPSNDDLQLLEAVSRENLLEAEKEVELVKQIQLAEGDVEAAKERLLSANRYLVQKVAQKYVAEGFALDELIAEGNKGLERAIYKFDETPGFKFSSYAVWWIRESILRAIGQKANAETEEKESPISEQ